MTPPRQGTEEAAGRRFFLATAPSGGAAVLAPEDLHHALHVLRLTPGDRILGLDGVGSAWPLQVLATDRRSVQLEPTGEATLREPRPGTAGAELPWLDLCVSLPKAGRAEDMVERLTQLGAAAIRPLVTERTPPAVRDGGAKRLERLRRAGREACKQAGRLWLPEIHPQLAFDEALETSPGGAASAVLDPGAGTALGEWARARAAAKERSLVLWIGPEGGFTENEKAALMESGATPCRVAAHVLRIATAAEAASAVSLEAFL